MLLALTCLALPQPLQGDVHVAAFPATVVSGTAERVELELAPRAIAALRTHERLDLLGLPWDGGLDLELRREAAPVMSGALHVDGVRAPDALPARASFWHGHVRGEPGSDVFLAFTGRIAWGWVQRDDELVHVLSQPDAAGDWRRASTLLITDRAYTASGHSFAPICATPETLDPAPAAPPRTVDTNRTQMLYGHLAVETDWQFFQLFGDLQAAESYVVALLAAANTRFRAQIEVNMATVYLGFHTTPADPWRAQDSGGDCFDALFEFQAAWSNGGAPVEADLHHLLSGASLGCGVGFIDALCDPDRGFSLTSHMDGLTPFPVDVSPLNWDFVWMCHEIGHNFGTLHTHQYCPPLDECSPAGYWGPCQDEMACTPTGTMMSYCHACPGGMTNFTTWFHPVVADTMRAASEHSCFVPFLRW